MKTNAYKKLISLILALALVVSASSFAFADDSGSEDISESEYNSFEQDFINSYNSDSDRLVRIAIVDSVRYVTPPVGSETVADVYELLYTCWTSINLHYALYVYDDNNYSRLTDIYNSISAIESSLYGNTGIATGDIWTLLKQVANALDNGISGTMASDIDLISRELSLGLFDNNATPYLVTVNNTIHDALFHGNMSLAYMFYPVYDYMTDVLNPNSLVNTQLAIQDNTSTIATNTTHIDSDLDDIISMLDDIKNFYYMSTTTDDITYYQNYNYIVNDSQCKVAQTVNNKFPVSFRSDINRYDITVRLPILDSSYFINNRNFAIILHNENLTFDNSRVGQCLLSYLQNNTNNIGDTFSKIQNVRIEAKVSGDGHSIYIFPFLYKSGTNPTLDSIYRSINMDYLGFYSASLQLGGTGVNMNNVLYDFDIYTVSTVNVNIEYLSHIDNDLHIGLDILNIFKELYASDDLISAKENQQQLEDSVLEDFTGSGSASASVGDAVNIKGVQNSLKGSLNTGDVNASGLSTILNTSSPSSDISFFKFWTQDVYNDINGVNNIPQTRSGNTYIFLNDSEELDRLIRSQSW